MAPILRSDAEYNNLGFRSGFVDREIDRLSATPDSPAHRTGWTTFSSQVAREDAPLVVLGDWQTARLHSARVRDLVVSPAKGGADLSLIALDP
jgi:hypothetical protein